MYTTILNKSEDEFWESTLRKLYSQIDIYAEINTPKNSKNKNSNNEKGGFVEGETITLKGCDD